jgi:DNA-binding transcriptional regulator YiaG
MKKSKITTIRKAYKLTQEQLAELLNLSVRTIRRWEKRERHIKTNDLIKLIEVLNLSPLEVFNIIMDFKEMEMESHAKSNDK